MKVTHSWEGQRRYTLGRCLPKAVIDKYSATKIYKLFNGMRLDIHAVEQMSEENYFFLLGSKIAQELYKTYKDKCVCEDSGVCESCLHAATLLITEHPPVNDPEYDGAETRALVRSRRQYVRRYIHGTLKRGPDTSQLNALMYAEWETNSYFSRIFRSRVFPYVHMETQPNNPSYRRLFVRVMNICKEAAFRLKYEGFSSSFPREDEMFTPISRMVRSTSNTPISQPPSSSSAPSPTHSPQPTPPPSSNILTTSVNDSKSEEIIPFYFITSIISDYGCGQNRK